MKTIWRRNRNILLFAIILCIIFIFWFIAGCGGDTDRQTFKEDVIDRLPDTWKYFAIEGIENFLNKNSDRYDKSFLDIIGEKSPDLVEKHLLTLSIWEAYQSSSESEAYNKLVKRILELKRVQTKQSKALEKRLEESLKSIRNRDIGITEDVEKKLNKLIEDKFRLSLQLVNREKYDNCWYTIETLKADGLKLLSVAILEIYFNGLPTMEIYFYKDPENGNWLSFCSRIKFYEYYKLKKIK